MATLIKPRGTTGSKAPARPSSKFQYRQRSPEEVRQRAAAAIGGRDSFFSPDVQFFTPAVGDNCVRILPPPPDADWGHYGINLVVHYDIGADGSAYLCLDKMKGEPCPICEERERASAAGETDLADQLKPGYRVGMYVINRNKESAGPLLYNVPSGMDKDITKLCIHPKTGEVLAVDHPDEGYDLSFTREGQGLTTKYKGLQFDRKPSPLSEDGEDADKWLQYIVEHPLDQQLVFHDYDHILKVFSGTAPPAAEAGDSKPDKPAQRGNKAAKEESKATAPAAGKKPLLGRKKPAPEPDPADQKDDVPSWDELAEMDDAALADLGEAMEIDFPDDGFESVEELRSFVAEKLGIEEPAADPEPEPESAPAAKGGSWRDRLKAKK